MTTEAEPSSPRPPATRPRTQARFFTLTLLLLVCSVAINFLLARRIAALNSTLLYVKAENTLAVGAQVPPISGKNLSGTEVSVSYTDQDRPTVLYVFTPECVWCKKNLESVRAFNEQVRGSYRVVGMSLSSRGLRDYVTQNGLAFDVVSDIPPPVVMAYKLGGTPQTVVISREGKVLKSWYGAYFGNTKREIEEFFHTQLPQLDPRREPADAHGPASP